MPKVVFSIGALSAADNPRPSTLRVSVMGGEQAASVLAQIRRDNLEARGE